MQDMRVVDVPDAMPTVHEVPVAVCSLASVILLIYHSDISFLSHHAGGTMKAPTVGREPWIHWRAWPTAG
jgi:hypothetical protein